MKTSIRFGATLASIGGFMYLFLSQKLYLIGLIICLARIGQCMIINTATVCLTRLFPTQYVATAYGVVNFISHLFACLSPFVAEIKNPYPFIVFEGLLCVAIFTSFVLSEIPIKLKNDEMQDKKLNELLNKN